MNFQNLTIEPDPQNPGNWIVKGIITNYANEQIADFGPDGTSVCDWWPQQDSTWQLSIVNQFILLMASQIVAGTSE